MIGEKTYYVFNRGDHFRVSETDTPKTDDLIQKVTAENETEAVKKATGFDVIDLWEL